MNVRNKAAYSTIGNKYVFHGLSLCFSNTISDTLAAINRINASIGRKPVYLEIGSL